MSTRVQEAESHVAAHGLFGLRGGRRRYKPESSRPTDPTWAPSHATVGIAADEHEASLVRQLRYRVYVHEQGKQPSGVDWLRRELAGPLDPWSNLWYASDGRALVGTIAQTIIGPEFDLSRLPSALELDAFPCSTTCPIGFSGRFAIAPDHRSRWVLASLARHTYAYGRERGAKFDVMATNPALVPLFERLGYVRYSASAGYVIGEGVVIPMVLPATDYAHLDKVRSACLSAAAYFSPEPEWGAWLRAACPMIGVYYESDSRDQLRGGSLAQHSELPASIASELRAMGFVHNFPAGTELRRAGDRVTCTFLALDGRVSIERVDDGGGLTTGCAPDGVAFSRVAIRCETDAVVLCLPYAAFARLERRYPEHGARLQMLQARGEISAG